MNSGAATSSDVMKQEELEAQAGNKAGMQKAAINTNFIDAGAALSGRSASAKG